MRRHLGHSVAAIALVTMVSLVAPTGATAVGTRAPIWTAALAHDPANWLQPRAFVVSAHGDRLFTLLQAYNWVTGVVVYRVVAFGAGTGRELWRWSTTTEYPEAMEIGPRGGQVYVASESDPGVARLTALSASTGKVLWRASRRGGWWHLAVSPDGHTVYVSGVRPRTAAHRERRAVLAAYAAGTGALRWVVPLGASFYASEPGPLITSGDGSAIVAGIGVSGSRSQRCPDAAATAVSASDGRARWTTRLGRMQGCGSIGQVDVANGVAMVPWYRERYNARSEQDVNGLRITDGTVLWHRAFDGYGQTSEISAGRVAVSVERYDPNAMRLILLNARKGSTLWSKPAGSGTPVFSPNGRRLYVAGSVATDRGEGAAIVRVRSTSTGALLWASAPFAGPLEATPGKVVGSSWAYAVVGPQGNKVFVAGLNWYGNLGEESIRTISIFGAYRA